MSRKRIVISTPRPSAAIIIRLDILIGCCIALIGVEIMPAPNVLVALIAASVGAIMGAVAITFLLGRKEPRPLLEAAEALAQKYTLSSAVLEDCRDEVVEVSKQVFLRKPKGVRA